MKLATNFISNVEPTTVSADLSVVEFLLLTVEVPATNAAGAPFPPAEPLAMHFRGPFEVTIGGLVLRADEGDLDGRTGRMELRGNVRQR